MSYVILFVIAVVGGLVGGYCFAKNNKNKVAKIEEAVAKLEKKLGIDI